MGSQRILLREEEVPAGMVVDIIVEGEEEPVRDDKGPLRFRVLMGGVPLRRKFYSVEVGFQIFTDGKGGDPSMVVSSMEGFKPEIRFTPVHTFGLRDAPSNTRFVGFVDGALLLCGDHARDSYYKDMAIEFGRYEGALFALQVKSGYKVSDNVVLVPITEIGGNSRKEPAVSRAPR